MCSDEWRCRVKTDDLRPAHVPCPFLNCLSQMHSAFATAQRIPPSRFSKLAELRENTLCNVQGIVMSCYEPQRTQGTDYKSVLLLVDPTVPTDESAGGSSDAAIKAHLFFPRLEDHPCLAQSRVGDVFRGFKCTVKSYRGKLELNLSEKGGSTYEIVSGDHTNQLVRDGMSNEETELLFLRSYRLTLMEQDAAFARRASGPGQFVPRAYPRPAVPMMPAAQVPATGLSNPYATYRSINPPPLTHAPIAALASASFVAPAAIAFPPPVAAAAAAASTGPIVDLKKSLDMLVFPVAGSKGYLVDLAAVRLLTLTDPRGDGKRVSVVLWDGTGPRPGSIRPNSVAENVFATCWEPSVAQELKACGEGAWMEISKVRVAAHKQQVGDIELHFNEGTQIRRLAPTDPIVVARMQAYTAKEARFGVGSGQNVNTSNSTGTWTCRCGRVNATDTRTCAQCLTVVPMTVVQPQSGQDKWQCSHCHTLTFKSRTQCYGCQKPFNKDKDLPAFAAPMVRAAHAPPPLGTVASSAESEPKRLRRDLTEVVGVSDALCIRNDMTNEFVPRITRLANVTTHLQDNARFVVDVKVMRFHPLETRHFTRPYCGMCHNPLSGAALDLSKLGECETCGSLLDSNSLQFRYTVALDVRDGAVTIPVLLCGSSADLFFRGLSACDLWSNHQTHRYVAEKMDVLCNSGATVRLAIQSYIPAGATKRVYQIFNTILN